MTPPLSGPEAPRTVIVAYQPFADHTAEFLACLRDHLPVLRGEGLVTDQPPVVLRAASGAFVEVFEWRSDHAIEQAHHNPAVQALWARFGACCNYVPLASLPEAQQPFSPFQRVEPSSDALVV